MIPPSLFSAFNLGESRGRAFGLSVSSRRWLCLLAGLGLAVGCLSAKPLPVPFQSEYLAENWGLEDGFPENSCSGIVEAPDGYLWMGTFRGLVRFNGQQFKAWAPEAMPQLKTTGVINLHRDRRGRVWMSTMGGLVMNEGSSWKLWQENDGWGDRTDYVRCYAESAHGDFVVSRFGGKILRFENGVFRELPPIEGQGGSWCAFDQDGMLYAARSGTVFVWLGDGQWTKLALPSPAIPLGLGQTRHGEALVVYPNEVVRLRRGAVASRLLLSSAVEGYWQLTEDASGTLWLPGLEAGVYRIRPDGTVKHFLKADGLPHSGGMRAVLATGDGSIWIGSGVGGCARFRPPRFRHIGEAEGMGDRVILTLAPLRDGRVLLTTYGTGLAYFDGVKAVQPSLPNSLSRAYIRTVLRRRDDSIWLGTIGRGLFHLEGTELEPLASEMFELGEPINTLFEDSQRRLWVGGDRRVVVLENGRFSPVELPKTVPGARSTLFAERGDGVLLLARHNEVFAYGPGGLQPTPVVRLPADRRITTVLVDQEDRLWMGTAAHGVSVLGGGVLAHFGMERGLPGSSIASLVQDNLGQLWFGADRRVVRVSPGDLWRAARDSDYAFTLRVFDQNDGLRDLDFPDNTQPSVAKDDKGRLWFALVRGAAMVDPAELKLETMPPRVVVESVSFVPHGASRPVERLLGPGVSNISLPAGSRLIRIAYAALEFLAPRKQQFRVRLDETGEWQDMRNEAAVSFLELPPGLHTIQVQAAGSDGAWNRAGATLRFEIAPFYWQTAWFRGAVGLGLAGLVGGGVWIVSSRRLRAERDKIERERRLAEAQARLALVLESTSDFVQFSDAAGNLSYVNRAGRTLVGLAAQGELGAKPALSLMPEWAREIFEREVRPALALGGTWTGELALRHCDGREIPVSLVILAHHAPDGGLEFTSMIARDISAAKRHARVQDSLRRLAAALTVRLDPESLGRTVAEACRDIFRHDTFILVLLDERGEVERGVYTEDTPEGETAPREFPSTIRTLSAALRPVTRGTPLLVNRDGGENEATLREFRPHGSVSRRGASLMFVPVQWAEKVIGVLTVQSYQVQRYNHGDLQQLQTLADHCGAAIARMKAETSLRKNEEQLRQSQKLEAVGTLAGGIAHDFNNILSAILGNAELAALEYPAEAALRAYLDQIRNSTHRARDLVRRLLTFSRPQENQRQVMALPPVVEDVAKLLRATIPASVEIQTSVAGDLPQVDVDNSELHQVLLNLGTNAAHALGSRPGRIEFRVEHRSLEPDAPKPHAELQPGGYVCVEIRDNGRGIPADILPRIFDPFFTTKAPGEGTGLGLSMAHSIMRAHGGAITVASTVGVGTVFQLYFPVASRPRAEVPPAASAPRAAAFGRGEHILCVDDEPAIVAVMEQVLRHAGFVVTGCTSPEQALAVFSANPAAVALVVTDLSMPRMSGLALTKRLLQLRPDLPVVLTSGYLRAGEMDEALQAGVREFVQKPSGLERMVAVVSRLLAGDAGGGH